MEESRARPEAAKQRSKDILWFLLLLWLSPGSSLNLSVWRALDSTVATLSQGGGEDSDEDDGDAPRYPAPERSPPRAAERYKTPSMPVKRKRVTPFVAKKVGALYSWRCAACGELLTEDFEVDHHLSLQHGGSDDIANLRPLHKRCHLLKNSLEQRRS